MACALLTIATGCKNDQASTAKPLRPVLFAERSVLVASEQISIDHVFMPEVLAAPAWISSVQTSCTCAGISVSEGEIIRQSGPFPVTLSMTLSKGIAKHVSSAKIAFSNGQAVELRLSVETKERIRIEGLSFQQQITSDQTCVPISCQVVTVSPQNEASPKPEVSVDSGTTYSLELTRHGSTDFGFLEREYNVKAGLRVPSATSDFRSAIRAHLPGSQGVSSSCYKLLRVERIPEVRFESEDTFIRSRETPVRLTAQKPSGLQGCEFSVSSEDFVLEVLSHSDTIAILQVSVRGDTRKGVHACRISVMSDGRCVGTKKVAAILD